MSPATVNGTVLEPVVASVAAGTSVVANGSVETVVIGSVVVVAAVAETVSVARRGDGLRPGSLRSCDPMSCSRTSYGRGRGPSRPP